MGKRYDLEDALARAFCVYLYREDQKDSLKSAADYNGLEERAIHLNKHSPLLHARVDSLTSQVLCIINAHSDYAALEAERDRLREDKEAFFRGMGEARRERKEAQDKADRLRELLTECGERVCAEMCPSKWKTKEGQRHSDLCNKIKEELDGRARCSKDSQA